MKRSEIMISDRCPTSLGDSVMFQWQMLQRSLREAITSHFEQGHDVEGFEQRPENCGDSLDALNELAQQLSATASQPPTAVDLRAGADGAGQMCPSRIPVVQYLRKPRRSGS